MSTAPIFIDTDEQAIIARLQAKYTELTGRTLQPAQVETLIINMVAYEMQVIRQGLQYAATQMLVSFANAPALDYLAELVGAIRQSASGAVTTIQFTVATGHPGVVIPAGTRVATADGLAIFSTASALTIASGATMGSVTAIATDPGTQGNGYAIGTVTGILDPRPYLVSASNTSTTQSGADAETDEEFRERIKLAPSQFSVAGPVDAYKYFARAVSPSIIDVSVTNPTPGTVRVYPLVAGGIVTPSGILTQVLAALSAEDIRPLSDTVEVLSPALVNYDVEIEITAYADADPDTVEAAALAAVETYTLTRQGQLGQDIKLSQLIALAVGTSGQVFDVTVISPSADVTITATQVGVCDSITITVTGTSNG